MNLTLAKAVDRYAGSVVCYLLAGLRQLRNMVAPRTALVETRTLLLIKFWGLGNMVLLIPVVRELRQRFPDARIVFVSLRRNRPLLEAMDALDQRIYIDDRNGFALAATLFAAVFKAWRTRPQLCVDFEQFARFSAILAVLARAQQIVGLATPGQVRSVLYHKPIPYDDDQHMGQTYLDLARAAGVRTLAYRPWPVPYLPEHVAEVRSLLPDEVPGALVVLHPGSGDNFQGRRWPATAFAELADRLVAQYGATVVITGTEAERPLVEQVVGATTAQATSQAGPSVVGAAGRLSVLGLAALLDEADLLVTNDTAPVHLGSAAGTPVLAFFGPNTPRLYGPLSTGSHAFYAALPCSPCLTNMNYKTSLCRMPVCIRDITVDEVERRVAACLSERDQLRARRQRDTAGPRDADDPPDAGGDRHVRAG